MSILYCGIACSNRILCEQHNGTRDFSSKVRGALNNVAQQDYVTMAIDNCHYNALNRNGLSFIAITDANASQQQTLTFLRQLESKFTAQSSRVSQALSGGEGCLQLEYSRTLAAEMASFSAQEMTQLTALRGQVEDVSVIIRNNIEQVMERGGRLDDLSAKTDELQSNANMFQTTARQVRQKAWWDNCRMKMIIAGVITLIAVVILLLILWQTGAFNGGSSGSAASDPASGSNGGSGTGAT